MSIFTGILCIICVLAFFVILANLGYDWRQGK